jgi:predicted transcriptional regulator
MTLALDLVDDVNRTVDMINLTETLRGQLASLRAVLAGESGPQDVRDAAEALDKKVVALEEDLFQMRVSGRGQDILRWPMKLAEQLLYLASKVTGGDFAPTAADRDVHQILHDQATKLKADLDELVARDVAQFNATLVEKKLTGIVARP